ncbi:MAG: chromosome segregation protein SMC [Alphaproteobacteria bacterium]|nr:chromosome segregation protein SMC [Alphaproteobacteria bacterium]
MHIRKLELQGFKSFVDRQTFHFGSGLAGVVGPNGCGKSNIVDAIRWAIGEQSAKSLRGAAMQDVIFNGSAVRKPVGLAEVQITFAAGEEPFPGEYARFEEVQVGRRLYRDGSSEYLLNQTRVRRRDVVDFFMDTGVGNKLYSFIQQGEIGRIVQARPEERRSLIEEAAGISKYKARREEAEAKLESTAQNLDRATDLAEEMGRRLRVLERQVEKATRFRRLRAQIRQGELFLGLVKYSGLSAERRELTGDLRVARDDAARLTRDFERQDADLSLRRDEIKVMTAVVSDLRDQLSELEAQRREAESARHFHAREREELRARLDVLAHDLDEAEHQGARDALEAERTRAELNEAQALLEDHEAALSERRLRADELGRTLVGLRSRVDTLKRQVMDCITGLVRHRTQLSSVGHRRQDLTDRAEQLATEQADIAGERALLDARHDQAQEAVSDAEAAQARADLAVESVGDELADAEKGLRQAQEAHRAARRQLANAERDAARLETQVHAVQELLSTHAGVEGGAAKALGAPGALGTLAEHLDVPEDLEPVVTAALGDALDTVIFADTAAMLSAAATLQQAGRTGLLVDREAEPAPGSLAARLGGTPLGRRALAVLLGDTRVTDTLAEALDAWARSGAPVATRDGARVLASGLALVGRAGTGAGAAVLRRRRKLAELEAHLTAAHALVHTAAEAADQAEADEREQSLAVERLRAATQGLRDALREAQLAVSQARVKQREVERERSATDQRVRQLATQEQRLRDQIAGIEREAEQHRVAIERDEERQLLLEDELKVAQAELVRMEDDATRAREALARAQTERGAIRERVVLLEKGFAAASQRAEDARRAQERARGEIQRSEQRLVTLDGEQTAVAERLRTLAEQQGELGERLKSERTRLGREREVVERDEATVRALRARVEAARGQATRLELKLQEVKLSIDGLREQVEGRYQVSLPGLLDRLEREAALIIEAGEAAQAVVPGRAPDPVPDLRITPNLMQRPDAIRGWVEKLEKLKADLDKLGEVNLAALQEYEEVSERFEWLEAQRLDLYESVEHIRRTIAKINRTCRERFRETFDLVDAHFKQIYPSLAGGGQARLSLTNEDDLLETGVDIFVQPPGKRLQNLTLLSGGEKALCAIGLIFALFKVKPSPFCLLDEVDAPLDEGNGARFNDVLREMSSLTQFIVITHNKKTMESVDTLYGVTMPDPGVSRLVTVRVS